MIINVPAISYKHYQDKEVPMILEKLAEIKANYGTIINLISSITNVPANVIIAFIFIESRGNEKAESFICNAKKPYECPVGLMQITAETATGVIFYENKQGRLLPNEKAILQKYISQDKLNCIYSMQFFGHPVKCSTITVKSGRNVGQIIQKKDLLNPELNILIGTMLIGQLIDQHTENGVPRMDKVVVRYNAGYFYKPQGSTIQETVNLVPSESKSYIYKLLGINGILSLLKNAA
jgi:hypothetical protein